MIWKLQQAWCWILTRHRQHKGIMQFSSVGIETYIECNCGLRWTPYPGNPMAAPAPVDAS